MEEYVQQLSRLCSDFLGRCRAFPRPRMTLRRRPSKGCDEPRRKSEHLLRQFSLIRNDVYRPAKSYWSQQDRRFQSQLIGKTIGKKTQQDRLVRRSFQMNFLAIRCTHLLTSPPAFYCPHTA